MQSHSCIPSWEPTANAVAPMHALEGRRVLGVLGGMGPAATSYFFDELVRHTLASCDQEHVDAIVMNHASMPDRTTAIKEGRSESAIALLQHDARLLESMGAGVIAIPCNTSHSWIDWVQEAVQADVINMIAETALEAVYVREARAVGIMATDGTLRMGLYAKAIEQLGARAVLPEEQTQANIMSLIYDEVKAGKPCTPEFFEGAVAEFKNKGCDCVILGCTELSVYKRDYGMPPCCLDAFDILVRESIIRCGGVYQ